MEVDMPKPVGDSGKVYTQGQVSQTPAKVPDGSVAGRAVKHSKEKTSASDTAKKALGKIKGTLDYDKLSAAKANVKLGFYDKLYRVKDKISSPVKQDQSSPKTAEDQLIDKYLSDKCYQKGYMKLEYLKELIQDLESNFDVDKLANALNSRTQGNEHNKIERFRQAIFDARSS